MKSTRQKVFLAPVYLNKLNTMKPKILLRIASIIMFLHDIGHTFGHLTWKQSPDPAKQEVIKQMTDNKFPFMGAVRSMSDYYDGYGCALTLALLLIAALAWGIDELIFFLPCAAAFSLLSFLLTGIAIFQIRNQKT